MHYSCNHLVIHKRYNHALFMQQSCYPQEHNHALAMHSHSCIFIHAFTFILLFTRAHVHCYPCIHILAFLFMQYHTCIVIHLVIHKITSTPQHLSCYAQDHISIGAVSLSVHYGDQRTPTSCLYHHIHAIHCIKSMLINHIVVYPTKLC